MAIYLPTVITPSSSPAFSWTSPDNAKDGDFGTLASISVSASEGDSTALASLTGSAWAVLPATECAYAAKIHIVTGGTAADRHGSLGFTFTQSGGPPFRSGFAVSTSWSGTNIDQTVDIIITVIQVISAGGAESEVPPLLSFLNDGSRVGTLRVNLTVFAPAVPGSATATLEVIDIFASDNIFTGPADLVAVLL